MSTAALEALNAALAAKVQPYIPPTDPVVTAGALPTIQFATGASQAKRSLLDRWTDAVNVLDTYQPTDPDLSAAFTRAIATGKLVRVPKLATGYDINSQVTVPSGCHIFFEGTSTVRSTSATSIFRLTGFDIASSIEGHAIFDMTAAPAGSSAIRFGTGSGVVYRVALRDLRFQNCFSAVDCEPHATNYVVDIETRNLYAELTRSRQFYIMRSRGFLTVDMRVDHTRNTSDVTFEGIRLEDAAGLDIQRIDVVGPSTATVPTEIYRNTAFGLVISNPAGTVASIYNNGRILVDTTRGPGVLFNNITNFIGGQIQVYGILGQGVIGLGCADFNTSISVFGLKGDPAALLAPAVEFDNSQRIRGSVVVQNSPASGLYLNNCTDCTLDVLSIDNADKGVVETGARNRLSGTMRGTGGTFSIAGTGSVATNYYANDNAFHLGPTSGALA
jgi:hypothetical protein